MSDTTCGNARHPNGPWHQAEPLPFYSLWNWRARLAFWWRRRKWGCGCPAQGACPHVRPETRIACQPCFDEAIGDWCESMGDRTRGAKGA